MFHNRRNTAVAVTLDIPHGTIEAVVTTSRDASLYNAESCDVTKASITALGDVLAFLHRFEPVEVAARGMFVELAFAHSGLCCSKRMLGLSFDFSCVILCWVTDVG